MSDKIYTIPVLGWKLFDGGLASVTDNHGNRVSSWSASCANGHEEGYVLNLDKIRLFGEIEWAAFKDLPGTLVGEINLGRLPSPLESYCDAAKQRAGQTRE